MEEARVEEPGLRLDRFLALRFAGRSRGHWQELIRRGCVRVDGIPRPADYRLKPQELVSVELPAPDWARQELEPWVLLEDKDLLVLDKPPGLLVHPVGSSWLETPEAALSEPEPNLAGLLLARRPAIATSGAPRCGLVHRLDRQTSGVLVVAKTPEAHKGLQEDFAARRVEKVYRAVVLGEVKGALEVEAPVGRPSGRRRIAVTPWGKGASTGFRVAARARGASLVEARPLSGRTHQIRAHLAFARHPVLGDPEQPEASAAALARLGLPAPPRMMLHAWKLAFSHPRTGKTVRVCAPAPRDFREYWASLPPQRAGGKSA